MMNVFIDFATAVKEKILLEMDISVNRAHSSLFPWLPLCVKSASALLPPVLHPFGVCVDVMSFSNPGLVR
jgi:hypothetical protein